MPDKPPSLTYASLDNEGKVYNFEFIFAEALRVVFSAAEMTAYTGFTPPELQTDRPRVIIDFTPGAGQGQINPILGRDALFAGQYRLIVTSEASRPIHSAHVAKVRRLMHRLDLLINDTEPMKFHCAQYGSVQDAGTSAATVPQDGYFQTTLIFNLLFSIQADAWALIDNSVPQAA